MFQGRLIIERWCHENTMVFLSIRKWRNYFCISPSKREMNFITTLFRNCLDCYPKKGWEMSWFARQGEYLPSIESWALALPLVPTTFLAKHWYFASSSSSSWVMTRDPSTSMDILKRKWWIRIRLDKICSHHATHHRNAFFIDDKAPLLSKGHIKLE